jgi:hypothetical protein
MASGGIARGRLAEERKSWRRSHPHVCTIILDTSSFYITRSLDRLLAVFRFGHGCDAVARIFLFRASWLSRRRCRMGPST